MTPKDILPSRFEEVAIRMSDQKHSEAEIIAGGIDVLAVMADQSRYKAERMYVPGPFEPKKCNQCGMKFYLGHHQAYPPSHAPDYYYSMLQGFFDDDHKTHDDHADYYVLGN
jgi:hypothetical protein